MNTRVIITSALSSAKSICDTIINGVTSFNKSCCLQRNKEILDKDLNKISTH